MGKLIVAALFAFFCANTVVLADEHKEGDHKDAAAHVDGHDANHDGAAAPAAAPAEDAKKAKKGKKK